MKRNIYLWQFCGFAFVSLLGTLLHFLYDITNSSIFASPFSAVNESTWEHMKILYFPLLIFALLQSFFFQKYESFWCIKLIGILIGLILIPTLFYTYNGAIGPSPDWVNITIFFISAAVALFTEARLFKSGNIFCPFSRLSFLLICIIGVLFVVFTFAAPEIPLFRDPLTGTYGI